jgi:hypothetical protein
MISVLNTQKTLREARNPATANLGKMAPRQGVVKVA